MVAGDDLAGDRQQRKRQVAMTYVIHVDGDKVHARAFSSLSEMNEDEPATDSLVNLLNAVGVKVSNSLPEKLKEQFAERQKEVLSSLDVFTPVKVKPAH